ncbi:hypothetical protein, partial [Nocardia farcinica]|uniref:hypothetical protein n=1 Tax=Nocardia farcinica TaxID=37329 RepID=UPI0024575006
PIFFLFFWGTPDLYLVINWSAAFFLKYSPPQPVRASGAVPTTTPAPSPQTAGENCRVTD